ncbi:MAG TPA: acyl carrier protein [Rhodocyclaceae bacterium]|nr:acyl carrier protein [Rhodocyclaceae bacterium]
MTSDCSQPECLTARGNDADVVSTQVASTLRKIWQGILHISDIKPDDDFFELGGDSLAAIRVLVEIGRAFGDELLEPDIIYTASRFGDLVGAITSALAQSPSLSVSRT